MTLARSYRTAGAEFWDALTNAQRIGRWFLRVGRTLAAGGRYRLEGKASGVITACLRPSRLALTSEFGDDVSRVEVRLPPEGTHRTRLTLTHTSRVSEHWAEYGSGETGVGWELGLMALAIHVTAPDAPGLDESAFAAPPEGKAHGLAGRTT